MGEQQDKTTQLRQALASVNEMLQGDLNMSVPYRPTITQQLGGNPAATILLQQVFFRWIGNGCEPFYKFNEPCSHKLYVPSDSWTEELGFTRRIFETARKAIAVHKPQEMSMQEAWDLAKEERKPVIYWTNAGRVTYYHVRTDVLLSILTAARAEANHLKRSRQEHREKNDPWAEALEFLRGKTPQPPEDPEHSQEAQQTETGLGNQELMAESYISKSADRTLANGANSHLVTDDPANTISKITMLDQPKEEHDPLLKEIWQSTTRELEWQMTQATFDTWIRPCHLAELDLVLGSALVHCPTQYIQDWLKNRLNPPIQRTLGGILGPRLQTDELVVTYEVDPNAPQGLSPQPLPQQQVPPSSPAGQDPDRIVSVTVRSGDTERITRLEPEG
jgi:hypothetical protein